LSGKGQLSSGGAVYLARILADSAMPSVLTELDLRCVIIVGLTFVNNGMNCFVVDLCEQVVEGDVGNGPRDICMGNKAIMSKIEF
jgi:hypothetical protein